MDILQEYALAWRASGRSALTVATYLTWLRRIDAAVGHLPPTLTEARQWVAQQRDNGMRSQTLHVDVRALKSFSKWYAEEMDEDDILAKLPYPKLDASLPGKVASNDDVERLSTRRRSPAWKTWATKTMSSSV